MILNGCMAMPGHISAKPRPFETIYPSFSIYSRCSTQRTQLNASQHSRCSPLRAAVLKPVSISSGSAQNGCHDSFSRRGSLTLVRASKDIPLSGYRYPVMKKKPRWWWRTLACIPYLMPLHETWMYAETAYSLHPFLEDFEFLTYPFLRFIGSFPGWFLMAYFFVAYLGVVRRKEWPHFFRFHVVMGMLLEITLQVTGTISKWLPLGLYWGKLGMHFWTALAFSYLFTVLECIRCALAGMYADVPFASDAAYIQIPYD